MIIAYTTVYTQCTQARARAHIVHMYEVFIILIFLLFSCPFYSMRSIFLYFRNLICIVRQVFSRIFLELVLLRDGYVTTVCFSLPYMLCNFISYSVRILMNYKISPNSPNYWRNATNTRCAQIQRHLASSRFCRQWRNGECFELSEAHK